MTIKDLNSNILFERDMDELQKAFAIAIEDLKTDVEIKITLKKIKSFVAKYEDFSNQYTIDKKRISVIAEFSKQVIDYLQKKINNLDKVLTVDKSEIAPLQDYLNDFKINVEVNMDVQRQKYNQARHN